MPTDDAIPNEITSTDSDTFHGANVAQRETGICSSMRHTSFRSLHVSLPSSVPPYAQHHNKQCQMDSTNSWAPLGTSDCSGKSTAWVPKYLFPPHFLAVGEMCRCHKIYSGAYSLSCSQTYSNRRIYWWNTSCISLKVTSIHILETNSSISPALLHIFSFIQSFKIPSKQNSHGLKSGEFGCGPMCIM
jgi:hypothetical protein